MCNLPDREVEDEVSMLAREVVFQHSPVLLQPMVMTSEI